MFIFKIKNKISKKFFTLLVGIQKEVLKSWWRFS
jgi:hypothetical protein